MPVVAALEVELVGLEMLGSVAHRAAGIAHQRGHQRLRDRCHDLVLDLEDVRHLAVVCPRRLLQLDDDVDADDAHVDGVEVVLIVEVRQAKVETTANADSGGQIDFCAERDAEVRALDLRLVITFEIDLA